MPFEEETTMISTAINLGWSIVEVAEIGTLVTLTGIAVMLLAPFMVEAVAEEVVVEGVTVAEGDASPIFPGDQTTE